MDTVYFSPIDETLEHSVDHAFANIVQDYNIIDCSMNYTTGTTNFVLSYSRFHFYTAAFSYRNFFQSCSKTY